MGSTITISAAVLQPSGQSATPGHPLGDLEIHYFCWFGAGEIDRPETRVQLADAWGLCHRHALGFLAVEAAVNHGWLFRPAMVYDAVLDRARAALTPHRFFGRQRALMDLRSGEPCPACALRLTRAQPASPEVAAIVEEGRNLTPLLALGDETRALWARWVCGPCSGTDAPARCRLHLADDLANARPVDMLGQRQVVEELSEHLAVFARSFGWAGRGTDTLLDRAALIGSVGWCGGWQSILRYLG